MYRPYLKYVAIPVPEIMAIGFWVRLRTVQSRERRAAKGFANGTVRNSICEFT